MRMCYSFFNFMFSLDTTISKYPVCMHVGGNLRYVRWNMGPSIFFLVGDVINESRADNGSAVIRHNKL